MVGFRITESGPGLFAPGYSRAQAWNNLKARLIPAPAWFDIDPATYTFIGLDLAKEPRTSEPKPGSMTEDDAPIGIVDGKAITVDKDAPRWRPTVVDEHGNPVELGDDD